MGEPPATRPSLLVRLRDPRDAQAWQELVALYAPLIYGFGRKKGLQDADAADLTQEVLRAVSAGAGRACLRMSRPRCPRTWKAVAVARLPWKG